MKNSHQGWCALQKVTPGITMVKSCNAVININHESAFSPSEMAGRVVVSDGMRFLAATKRMAIRMAPKSSEIQGKMARRTAVEKSKYQKLSRRTTPDDVPGCSLLYLVDSPSAASVACTTCAGSCLPPRKASILALRVARKTV